MKLTPNLIHRALTIPEFDGPAAWQKMMRVGRNIARPADREGTVRTGAVLALLYEVDGEAFVALTKRRADLGDHAGQVSFPGGRVEKGEAMESAALRETQEEIGISPHKIQILGELTKLYINPSDFDVYPFVGWHEGQPGFVPAESEVAQIIEAPLNVLLNPDTVESELWNFGEREMDVSFFNVQGHKVWGATAMMLSELLSRLQQADGQ